MMRLRRLILLTTALLVMMGAYAGADEVNTFLDGKSSSSLRACAGGGFVYWLREDMNIPWDNPSSLYRMRPEDAEAELLLKGSDDFWMWSVIDVGDSLVIDSSGSFGSEDYTLTRVDYDGKTLSTLARGVSTAFFADGTLYAQDDKAIYGISLDTGKMETLYTLDKNRRNREFYLMQRAGNSLYFYLGKSCYSLDLSTGKARKLVTVRGSFFVAGDFFYYSDYDDPATYRNL